jgi:hypothetical protein
MFACKPERHINTNRGDNKLPRPTLEGFGSNRIAPRPSPPRPRRCLPGEGHD